MSLFLDDPIGSPRRHAHVIAGNDHRLREKFSAGIVTGDLADDTVTAAKIAADAVGTSELAPQRGYEYRGRRQLPPSPTRSSTWPPRSSRKNASGRSSSRKWT